MSAKKERYTPPPPEIYSVLWSALVICINFFLFLVYLIYLHICLNDGVFRFNLNSVISYNVSYDLPTKEGTYALYAPPLQMATGIIACR